MSRYELFEIMNRVHNAEEARRLTAQQRPVTAFYHLYEVRDVICNSIDVRILPVVKNFDIPIATIKFSMQPVSHYLLIKYRRLLQ